jgi:hypothetical protein
MNRLNRLSTLIWVYVGLLILEGALRKWIVPSLDTPLLIIRDPLVMWIYYRAWQSRLLFNNAFFAPNLALAVATTLTSMVFGSGNLVVTVYGLRTDFLQIPLIFLIPQILDREDVIVMGRFLLYMSIPMAVIVVLQFRASPDHWLNKGAMETHYGTVRPSGTFSFIAGLDAFFCLVSSFLFFGYTQARTYTIWLMVLVTCATIITSVCSGSRSCLVSIGIVAVVTILCVLMRGKGGMGILVAAVLIALAIPLMLSLPVFQEGAEQLTMRFQDAGQTENGAEGFVARFVDTMVGPIFHDIGTVPNFGYGLGMGTNAAAGLLRGDRGFNNPDEEGRRPEAEWGRLIYEGGPVFGLLLCIFRVVLTVAIARHAFEALRRDNILPMLIFAASGLLVLNGQWGVATTLGFAIFGGGLTLAACEEPPEEDEDDDEERDDQAEGESDHS